MQKAPETSGLGAESAVVTVQNLFRAGPDSLSLDKEPQNKARVLGVSS